MLHLLLGGGRHAVGGVFALHHLAVVVRLAGLDVVGAGGVQLETARLAAVVHLAHLVTREVIERLQRGYGRLERLQRA